MQRELDIRINNYKLRLHLVILNDEVLVCNKQIDNTRTKIARANGILSILHHFVHKKNLCATFMSFMAFWFGPTQLNVI